MLRNIGRLGEQLLGIRCIAFLVVDLGEPCHFCWHVSLDIELRGNRYGFPLSYFSSELTVDPK
jgi:hypothetical protein